MVSCRRGLEAERAKSRARLVVSTQLMDCLKSVFAALMSNFCEPAGKVQDLAIHVKLQQGR